MTNAGITPDLRLAFADIMNASEDGFRELFTSNGQSVDQLDMDFIKNLSNCSISELQESYDTMNAASAEQNRKLEADVFVSDRGIIEAAVENLEFVVCRTIADVRSKASSESSTSSVFQINTYREEKHKLKALIQNSPIISELLDIPHYVELCISSRQYSEATLVFQWFDQLQLDNPKLNSIGILQLLQAQLQTIQKNFVASIEHRLSGDMTFSSETEIEALVDILVMYHPKARDIDAHDSQQLKLALFLMYRMQCFYSQKARILSSSGPRVIKEYSELVRLFIPELMVQTLSLFGPTTPPPLSRFIVQETRLFEAFLLRSVPEVFRRNGLSSVADIFPVVIQTSEAVSRTGIVFDLAHVFESAFVDVIIKERIEKHIYEVFKSELGSYNWKAFTSLVPNDANEFDVIQLTRNRPIGILYNDITTVLNEVRIFPMQNASEALVRAIDKLALECFELLLSAVNNDGKSQIEFDTMIRNFCMILVLNTEVHLESLFDKKIDLISVKGHPRFIFRSSSQ